MACVVSSLRDQPFGGGPIQGGSATEQECVLLSHTEALLGLWLFDAPAQTDEVLLVRGVRRVALLRGAPHELRFVGVAPPSVTSTTLLFLDASRWPTPLRPSPTLTGARHAVR